MGSGNRKTPYVVNNFVTVYKLDFLVYPLSKSNFLSLLGLQEVRNIRMNLKYYNCD